MSTVISEQMDNQQRGFHFATSATLRASTLPGLDLADQTEVEAVLFRASATFVTSARHVGALWCGSGRLRVDGVLHGLVVFASANEGHVVLLPLGMPEVKGAVLQALTCGKLLAVASAPRRQGILIVVDAQKLETLLEASRDAQPASPGTTLATLVAAGRALLTSRGTGSLPPAFAGLRRVSVHVLVPDSLFAVRDEFTTKDTVIVH